MISECRVKSNHGKYERPLLSLVRYVVTNSKIFLNRSFVFCGDHQPTSSMVDANPQPPSAIAQNNESNNNIQTQNSSTTNKPNKKSNKKVIFERSDSGSSSIKATVVGYVPPRSEITTSEHRMIWWNKQELEQLMLTARSMCRNKRDDLQLSNNLSKGYNAISEKMELIHFNHNTNVINESTFKGSMSATHDFTIDDCHIKKSIHHLRKWETHSDYRGLETWVSYEHELARENAQRNLSRSVLSAQRTHRMRYGRICQKGTKESDTLWEGVSNASFTHSRHARLFAYSMGVADANEAGLEISTKKDKTSLFKKVAKALVLFKR